MKIGGLQKLSLVDYPGKVAASVFTIGCNFRCGYCHNPGLVVPERYAEEMDEGEVMAFLESRVGKLDAVVVSGGEPTLHRDLPEFMRRIKDMGYLIKLDSQGSNPDVLERLFAESLVDFVAMDVKGPLAKYEQIMGWAIDPERIKRSIRLIMRSKVGYEFRTTVVKSQLASEDFEEIGKLVKGAKRYALQRFRPNVEMVDTEGFRDAETYDEAEFEGFRQIMEKYVRECVVH